MYNHSVVKWHETTQMFVMVDYGRDMISKKSCKYGKHWVKVKVSQAGIILKRFVVSSTIT